MQAQGEQIVEQIRQEMPTNVVKQPELNIKAADNNLIVRPVLIYGGYGIPNNAQQAVAQVQQL